MKCEQSIICVKSTPTPFIFLYLTIHCKCVYYVTYILFLLHYYIVPPKMVELTLQHVSYRRHVKISNWSFEIAKNINSDYNGKGNFFHMFFSLSRLNICDWIRQQLMFFLIHFKASRTRPNILKSEKRIWEGD